MRASCVYAHGPNHAACLPYVSGHPKYLGFGLWSLVERRGLSPSFMVFHYLVCSNILEFVKIWVKFFILTFMQLNSKHNFYKIK